MKIVAEFSEEGVKLEQREDKHKRFRLTYGEAVHDDLNYASATTELGAALMHAWACRGLLDNTGD
ncbi:hypothetical protein AVU67_gp06 [Ralstonia phage RSJ2]|uniref:Uncharacterized protein n=1 Tax=Ralstonia phage RSJ2 TaxID=1481785 RepID=A0A068Q6F9_9CAUD|nr:hypothetical protein AVU67_gp06 [Ralstonia phage RSJ2]BAP15812.1 hypothetical protein [Ralstonia phage RSJ2]